ncbi:MAG TPA: hypothetical protein VG820_02670 [Fimbriimonadaceae bacterium]|nr:hypothetical protein [Fimbriimonadaceae bacterium]
MRAPWLAGIVRVTNTREELEEATQVAQERRREGYSPEALALAVDEILHNTPLSRAIAMYVESVDLKPAEESRFPWAPLFGSVAFAGFACWLVLLLFHQVDARIDLFTVLLIVLAQGSLIRMGLAALRLAVITVCDGLNDTSYPTRLHPNAPFAVGGLRLRRLRALLQETADRIVAGEKPAQLAAELSEVNLTPRAARIVVGLSRIGAILRGYLPPYQPRWIGYLLAVAFAVTAIVFVDRIGDRMAEGYKNYALGVAGLIAGELSTGPRRRPRSRAA